MTYGYIIAFLVGVIAGMIIWAFLFKAIKTDTYIETDDIVVKKNSINSEPKTNIFKRLFKKEEK